MRILIAEDNDVNQKVLKTILDRNAYQYEIAQNGAEAVEKYLANEYALVLMDCQMPLMDGLEATARIRAHETETRRPRCFIVAMTANAMKGDRERCLAAGMDDFLAKPFKSQDLALKLQQWTHGGGQ